MNRKEFLLASALGLWTACGKSQKIRLALNWKPEPQFGGFYVMPSEHAPMVEVLPGGAGTPTVQMIGAGSTEFGVVAGDEVVLARSRGNDVVGLFAVFQNCPQGIMVHASRNLSSIGEVFQGGTVAMQRGLPFARLLEKKYGFDRVKIVPSPGGDISAFLRDEMFAQQCFVTSEPLAARRLGATVKVFPVSDVGYNPYLTVLTTSGDYLRKNPLIVRDVVGAVRLAWRAYLYDPKPANERMNKLNPSMDMGTFAEVAEAQKPFIQTEETVRSGLGAMTAQRWDTLIKQLHDLGDIPQIIPAQDCFRSV